MANITESIVEEATLAWLEALGYSVLNGPDIAAGEPGAESSDPNCRDVVLLDSGKPMTADSRSFSCLFPGLHDCLH